MSILFGLLLARRFYCRSALSLSPGRTWGLLPRINAPEYTTAPEVHTPGAVYHLCLSENKFYKVYKTVFKLSQRELPVLLRGERSEHGTVSKIHSQDRSCGRTLPKKDLRRARRRYRSGESGELPYPS